MEGFRLLGSFDTSLNSRPAHLHQTACCHLQVSPGAAYLRDSPLLIYLVVATLGTHHPRWCD